MPGIPVERTADAAAAPEKSTTTMNRLGPDPKTQGRPGGHAVAISEDMGRYSEVFGSAAFSGAPLDVSTPPRPL